MSITKAQAGNTATGTSTTPSATLTTGPAIGNAIVFTFSTGPAISTTGNLTQIPNAVNNTASSVAILWMPVVAGTSATQSITLVGSAAWDCRIDELTGSPSGAWQADLGANSTSPGSETTRAFAGGTTAFPDEYAIAVAGFNISETSVPWNLSLANDTTNLLNGTRSLTVASRVLTASGVSFSTLACGAWTTAGTTGGFAFATLAALPAFLGRRPDARRDPQVYTYFQNVIFGRNRQPAFDTSQSDGTVRPPWSDGEAFYWPTPRQADAITGTITTRRLLLASTPVTAPPPDADPTVTLRPVRAASPYQLWWRDPTSSQLQAQLWDRFGLGPSTPTDSGVQSDTGWPNTGPGRQSLFAWSFLSPRFPDALVNTLGFYHAIGASTPVDQVAAPDADPTVTRRRREEDSPYQLRWRDSTAQQAEQNLWERWSNGANTPVDIPAVTGWYLNLPGTFAYASTPDSVANSIVGDIDIRVRVALNSWAPTSAQGLVAKRDSITTISYTIQLASGGSAGKLNPFTSPDGTVASGFSSLSTVATGFAGGSLNWVRFTLDVNDGAGNRVYNYYTSTDYDPSVLGSGTWTPIGTTVTSAGTTSLFDSTSALEVGALNLGTLIPASGAFYRAQVLNGIGGTLRADMNPNDWVSGNSWVSSTTGETWTLNGDATIRSTFENFNRDDVKVPWLYANPYVLRWPRDTSVTHVENSYARRLRYATVTSAASVDADPTVTIPAFRVNANGYQLRWRDSTLNQIVAEELLLVRRQNSNDAPAPSDADPTLHIPWQALNPYQARWGRDSTMSAIGAWDAQLRLWYASTPTDPSAPADATVRATLQNPWQLRQGLTASPWQMIQHLRRRLTTIDLGLANQDTSLRPLWMMANGYAVRLPANDWPAELGTILRLRSFGGSTPVDVPALANDPTLIRLNYRALNSPYQLRWRDSTRAAITAFRLWRFSGEGKPFLPPDPGLLSFILASTGVTNADLVFDGATGLILVHDGRTFADVTVSGSTFLEIVDTGDTDYDQNTGRTSLKES